LAIAVFRAPLHRLDQSNSKEKIAGVEGSERFIKLDLTLK
jgi:hypothetical protein